MPNDKIFENEEIEDMPIIPEVPIQGGTPAHCHDGFGSELLDIASLPSGVTQIFYQATAPTTGVRKNDYWIDSDDNKIYRYSGSAWVEVQDDAIATAITNAATAQSTADGKIYVYKQDAAPASGMGTGDLWFDTDDGNKVYRYSGSAWDEVKDTGIATAIANAATAQGTADGKITTFIQTNAPTAEGTGDIWIDSDDGNKSYRWSGSAWVDIEDTGIATALADAATAISNAASAQTDATTGISNAATAQAEADRKIVSFYQTTAPTAEQTGDLWFDTDDDNKSYRWSGSAWNASEFDVASWSKIIDDDTHKPEDDAMNLDNHEASDLQAARNYDAVVAASGGDYTNIQAAINAGKTNIFVRKGTYTLSADIVLDSGISIIGEDKYDVIINLNGDHQIKAIGDTPYETGTITITKDDATIVGSGTSWSANLAVNDYIVFKGNVYKITEVTDNTHLEVRIIYKGGTESAVDCYYAGTFKHNIEIKNVTIKGHDVSAAKGALYLYGTVKSKIDNVIIKENDLAYTAGIKLEYAFNNDISNIEASNNGYSGVHLRYSCNNNLLNINANNNNWIGIYLVQSCVNNKLSNVNANSNGNGIILSGECDYNILTNIDASKTDVSNGIKLNGSDHNIITNSKIEENGRDGIRLDSSKYNIIANNQIRNNSQQTNDTYAEIFIYDTSTYNIISNNNIRCTATNKSKYGIREDSVNDDYNSIFGNIVNGAVTTNISTQGANIVIGATQKYVDDSGITYVEIVGTTLNDGGHLWNDWDLSGSIPANAKYAEIVAQGRVYSKILGVRKNGSALNRYFQSANLSNVYLLPHGNFTVELDANRIIETYGANTLTAGEKNRYICIGYWI